MATAWVLLIWFQCAFNSPTCQPGVWGIYPTREACVESLHTVLEIENEVRSVPPPRFACVQNTP